MKVFKIEKIVYFNAKRILKSKQKINYFNKFINSKVDFSENFLNKKLNRIHVDKHDNLCKIHFKMQKKGRWTLKEHIQFLQAFEKFGPQWDKISKVKYFLIPTRTSAQMRSHAQKFFKKMKMCMTQN